MGHTKQYWTIEEWIPPTHAISGKGFWTELEDGRTEFQEKARRWFGSLIGNCRTVRLVEHTSTVLAECAVPPCDQ